MKNSITFQITTISINSLLLKRQITIDCYHTVITENTDHLLLINDGQDLNSMNFLSILNNLQTNNLHHFFVYAGVHCSDDRKNEYGTAGILDYTGRGTTAVAYQQALIQEIIPAIETSLLNNNFKHYGIAGFSLGGLSAIDTLWNHSDTFSYCGVFSGSLWWRDLDQNDPAYDDDINRIMHRKIKKSHGRPGLRFFFEAGKLDETADRNNNGIIDAIEDTIDLISLLNDKGYINKNEIAYLELEDGKHDTATWAKAMPVFLNWLHHHDDTESTK